MGYYIKKPITIQATQFGDRDFIEWTQWVQKYYNEKQWSYRFDENTGIPNGFIVKTLEGEMAAGPGDYLIMGVKGEIYPCRKDIFEETYEKVYINKGAEAKWQD